MARRDRGSGVRGGVQDPHVVIARFLEGDPMIVAQVGNLARRVIGGQAYAIPYGDRDDIVQEVLIQVHQALSRPGADRSTGMAALVRTVTHRRCVDWCRGRRTLVEFEAGLASPSAPPEDALITAEMLERGRRVLDALTADCRQLICWRARDGLSHRDIALRLESTEGAVRTRLYRCLKTAREKLQEFEAEASPRSRKDR